MKALNFLKKLQESRDYDGNLEYSINEAVAELEEAMKPKTCDGCKWLVIGKYCALPIGACIRKSDDYFEPKDNA